MIYIGIDPGKKGACARIRVTTEWYRIEIWDLPLLGEGKNAELDSKRLLEWLTQYRDVTKLGVEKQQVFPAQRGPGAKLELYGAIKAAVRCAGWSLRVVSAKQWQKELFRNMAVPKDRLGKKKLSLKVARDLFPDVEITHDGQSDALLIAEFLRRGL